MGIRQGEAALTQETRSTGDCTFTALPLPGGCGKISPKVLMKRESSQATQARMYGEAESRNSSFQANISCSASSPQILTVE